MPDDLPESKKLAQVMVEPSFWRLQALNDYRTRGYSKNLNALDDVEMEEAANGDLKVTLVTMGVSYQIPAAEKPKMVRVVPALYHQGDKKRWIAVGFSGYYPVAGPAAAPDAVQAKFCGVDVLFDGMAPYADSVGRPPYPGSKPLEVKKYTVKSLQKDAAIVPFCQSVSKQGPFYRFDDYQPYAVSVSTP